MTCIVWRDGIMAADTRTCLGEMLTPQRAEKIWWSEHKGQPVIVGISGEIGWRDPLDDYIRGLAPIPDWNDDARTIVAFGPDQPVRLVGRGGMHEFEAPFCAIGSGAPAAVAAMHMGASAIRAVEIAALVDPYTGGDITTLAFADFYSVTYEKPQTVPPLIPAIPEDGYDYSWGAPPYFDKAGEWQRVEPQMMPIALPTALWCATGGTKHYVYANDRWLWRRKRADPRTAPVRWRGLDLSLPDRKATDQ